MFFGATWFAAAAKALTRAMRAGKYVDEGAEYAEEAAEPADEAAALGPCQLPDEPVPPGMSRSAYGNAVRGVGERGAQHPIGARTAAQLGELGLTVEKAQAVSSSYLHVFMRNRATTPHARGSSRWTTSLARWEAADE